MTPERWQQIEEVFHEALELEGEVRFNFIRERSGDDIELKAEVEKLLSQFDEASSFIEQPLYDSAKSGLLSSLLTDSDDDPMVGEVLGAYRIEREIGRGGMGAVYEAFRADGEFRLRVAVKVVKRGIDTDFVLRRFRNERQILAALDHPFITRLLDGGTTPDGRPYFVMEYIDGLPLYRYCDKDHLTTNERLRLFCRVCEAVEYAHQKQVIHRDLKPSNIFITNDGSPRLLDFGIAKLLDPEMASDTLEPTATALRMMTVDYASPEQIRGEKVTFATDVYSLGVILFELLTGYRPYSFASRSPHDVARSICDDEPLLPSAVAAGNVKEATPVRVNPNADTLSAASLSWPRHQTADPSELEGDLDRIILQALRKAPADRYASVDEFRRDIEAHIQGDAIAAAEIERRSDRRTIPGDPDAHSVAVLPLTMLSPAGEENTDEAYLTIGVADAIITRLTNVQRLTVRPTSSITRYTEDNVNPFRAGGELGVDYVLDGRIRRFGERIRISLQLLDIAKVKTIWAGHFDEHLTDVLELEDAISEQVAAALIPHLTGRDREKLSKRGTNDPQAFEAYLRGRVYWNQFTSQSLPKALEAYKTAVSLDPKYALAHTAIAEFYIWAGIYGLIPTVEAYRNAWDFVHRALSLDTDLAEAHAANALLLNNEFRFGPSEESFKRSIALNPHYALAREWYAALLIGNGRFDEGVEQMLLSEELDPMSLRTKILVIWYYFQTRHFDKALAKADEVVAIDPDYPQGHLQRGNILSLLDRHDEAIAEMKLADALMPSSALLEYHFCFVYQRAGLKDEARKLADKIELRSGTEFVKPYFLGMANIAAGRIDRGFHLIDVSLEERDAWLVWIGTDPSFDSVREDERYSRILRSTGREIADGRVRVAETWAFPDPSLTSMVGSTTSEAVTEPLSDTPTTQTRSAFIKRHRWKIAFAALTVLVLSVAYSTGIFSVAFKGGPENIMQSLQTEKRSIAVLPFVNETGDEANDYISDGLGDGLVRHLSSYPEIRTVSRANFERFQKERLDPQAIGRELGVDSVLVGSLTRRNESFSLTLRHINVSNGKVIFSISFIEAADKILTLQGELTSLTTEKLQLNTNAATNQTPRSYTENNEAFSLYLKGEYSRQKGTPAGTVESITFYQQAIEKDANYALAYQGLALAYRSAPAYGAMLPQEAYSKAKDAAQKALAIDPSLSTVYVSLASIKATYDWDYAGAEQEYKRAIQLNPNNAEAHYSYGNFLVAMGRVDEGLVEFRNAQQIDPMSLSIQTNIGWAMYIAGRYDEASNQIRQVIAKDPTYARAYLNLGEIQQEQGKYDEAIASFQKARELSKDPIADMALGHVYAAAGRRADAQKVAASLEDKVRNNEVSPFLPAVVYAGMNEKDKAFYWLERAYQERSNWLTLIKVGRRLKNLRGDPRFDDLLRRVGFQ